MGMGEPLANIRNLMQAIKIINAEWGIGIGARHMFQLVAWCHKLKKLLSNHYRSDLLFHFMGQLMKCVKK